MAFDSAKRVTENYIIIPWWMLLLLRMRPPTIAAMVTPANES